MTLVLGLDVGSTSTKATLVDVADGVRVLTTHRRRTPTTPVGLVTAAAALSRACATGADRPIAAIGIASMAESGAALDGRGDPLTGLLRWDRGVDPAHLAHLLELRPDLAAETGVPATTKPAAVTLAALRAERPGLFAATRHWTGVADLIAHALTGIRATDHTLAARTMLAGADADDWDTDLLGDLGADVRMLPEIMRPGTAVGTTDHRAEGFGLPRGVPVHIAGHDHAVGAWAAGARADGDVADSLGTAEAIVRVADAVDRPAAVAAGFAVSRTIDRAALTILGGSRACGAMLAAWDQEHPGDDAIVRLREVDPERWITSPVTVLPYPAGRQCPEPEPGARVRVHGAGDADARARGVLQSLILQSRWMREAADALAGSATASVVVLGSLAHRVPAWAPLAAASAPAAVRLAAIDEPVAVGAALLAAVRTAVAPATVALPAEPVVPAFARGLDDAYRRFRAFAAEAVSDDPSEGEA